MEQGRNTRGSIAFLSVHKPHSNKFYIQRRGDSIDIQLQCSSVNYLLLKIYNTRQTQTKF